MVSSDDQQGESQSECDEDEYFNKQRKNVKNSPEKLQRSGSKDSAKKPHKYFPLPKRNLIAITDSDQYSDDINFD